MPLYTPFGSAEGTITVGNDNRLSTAQVINVKKNPGDGEFSSVATAVASITDAGPSKYYVVKVGPGTYTEPEIVVPSYVFIQGTDIETTIIQPDADNHHAFSMSTVSGLSFLAITGVGVGYSGVSCVNVGYYVLLHKVDIYSLDIAITLNTTTTESWLFLEYVSVEDFSTNALKIVANGAVAHCTNENFYTDSTNVVGVSAIDVSGIGATLNMHASTIIGNVALGNDIGITFSDGVQASIESTSISGFYTGFYIPNIGSASGIILSSVTLYNSNSNISILHPGVTGSLNVSTDKSKVNLAANSLSVSIFDVLGNGLTLTDGLYQGTTFAQATNIVPLLQHQSSSGVMSGGVTSSVGFVASVTAGTGYLQIGTSPNRYLKHVSWGAQSTTIAANSEVYLYIDNTGTLQQSLSLMSPLQSINLVEVVSDASSIYLIQQIAVDATSIGTNNFTFLQEAIGPIFSTGALVTENATPGRLDVSSGCYFFATHEYCPSGGTAITFIPYYRNGSVVATPSGTIAYGSPSNGDTVIFTGLPTDGTKTFTKVASDPGANEFTSISELTALIQALTDLNATDNGTIITLTVVTTGAGMNSATVTGTGSYSALSITFSGGGSNGYIKGANRQDISSGPSTWQYDNNDGYLVSIPSDEFAKHSLYLVGEGADEKHLFVWGQTSYASLLLVEAADLPTPPGFVDNNIVLIASIIVGQGQVNIVEIRDERPIIGFKASGISATAYHGNLLGLLNDDHPQYLLVGGTRAMSGNLDMGTTNSIVNVNLVDGVDVSAHEARHLPNGLDPLTTAAPTTNLSATSINDVGIQNSLSRSDHSHAITFPEYYYAESLEESNTTSTYPTYLNKLTFNVTPVAGTYILEWDYQVVNSSAAFTTWAKVWDGTNIYTENRIVNDATYAATGWQERSGFIKLVLTAVNMNFYIDFCRNATGTAYMKGAKLLLRRVV